MTLKAWIGLSGAIYGPMTACSDHSNQSNGALIATKVGKLNKIANLI
jgi:hypothetical protein